MEPLISSHEVYICETCGDKGFTNAFVFCVKCLDFVIHRYCLDVFPKTFNERVIWYCEDCKPIIRNQVTSLEAKSSQSQTEKAATPEHVKVTHRKKKQRKERDIASIIAGTVVVSYQENITEPESECILPTDIPKETSKKSNTRYKRIASSSKPRKRKKIAAQADAKKKEHKPRNGLKTETRKDCKKMAGLVTDEQTHESQPCGPKKLSSDFLSMKEDPKKTTANMLQKNQDVVPNASLSADFVNNVPCGLPIIDPVWRGSFSIIDTDYDLFEGFVAHLSTKACEKVYKEASMLPSLLQLEMQSKTDLWPKSFQECEPSDVNIALYFFPGDQINEKSFDHLVIDMINEGLAMRAMAANAELLIFTSRVLPQFLWRFQGKYYLWGVFRAKKRSSSVANHDVTAVSNSDIHGLSKNDVKEVPTRVKTLNAHSPRSPLSNNGENGV